MDFPSAIHEQCPSCNKETLHKVLKGHLGTHKVLTLECTIKCTECNLIHQTVITEKKLINVPTIISTMDKSARKSVALHPDEELEVGQELIVDEQNVVITSLEVGGVRVSHATAKNVVTLWTKRTEINGKVQVKISVHKGPNTLSHKIDALPDEEFFIGDVLRIARDNVAIYKIKTYNKIVKYESAVAKDIVRIYGRVIR
ncbi:HVO_0476 family zinc finger protein [[Eubacterium] cellulosolvens]